MKKISINDLKSETGVGFGTSGIRDKIENLSNEVVYIYTTAFLKHVQKSFQFRKVAIAGDLRKSTPSIMKSVARAIIDNGNEVINCGFIPTPAATYYGIQNKIPSIMVTGSHIPDDRNGVKFNLPIGEILKKDEAEISNSEVEFEESLGDRPAELPEISAEAEREYVNRFIDFFPNNFLSNKKIGLYGHTAVGRDIFGEILEKLGAEVTKLDYRDVFLPLDTDIVDEELIGRMKKWKEEYDLDCIVSTDGDGDRPLMTDENGDYLRNDVMPIVVARYLEAEAVACTINCNSMVVKSNYFEKVVKTKIGSPQVIEAMNNLVNEGYSKVVSYEGNGGFLTATEITKNNKTLKALPTRDAVLPILCVLAASFESGKKVREIFSELPKAATYFSSIKGISTEKSLAALDNWKSYQNDIEEVYGKIIDINLLDGLRLTFENGDIVHFRPSKNAPEFRNYVESSDFEQAKILSGKAIELIKKWTS